MRHRITFANVMSAFAVFVVLGGTSYAAATLTGADIKNSSLTGKDVKNSSLTGKDIRNGSLRSADFGGGLPVGPAGPGGARGATGPAGANGAAGATGAKGDQGDQGDTGEVGPRGPSDAYTGFVAPGGACSDAQDVAIFARCQTLPTGKYQSTATVTAKNFTAAEKTVTCSLLGDAAWATSTLEISPGEQGVFMLVGAGVLTTPQQIRVSCSASAALITEGNPWTNQHIVTTAVENVRAGTGG